MNSEQPPPGFTDHGVAAPVGMSVWNGPVPALDADGRRIILIKLWAGVASPVSYYLLVDAETGKTIQIDPKARDSGAFCIFLSPDNRLYDTLDDTLIEFDPASRELRRIGPVPPQITMSWTWGEDGILYFGMYPNAELMSFRPGTRELTNYGPLATETWPQYPYLAVDDRGWVYAGIMHQRGNIVAFHPGTRERRPLYPEEKRGFSDGLTIWRGEDGKVYCRPDKGATWYRLYDGRAEELPGDPGVSRAGSATTAGPPGQWPDGSRFTTVDVANRRALVLDAGAESPREIGFEYTGARLGIWSLIGGPDGCIYGATGIPLRVFRLDPATGKMANWGMGGYGGHVNQWVGQGTKLYGAIYSSGALFEYDPARDFDDVEIGRGANPKLLYGPPEVRDLYGRPHAMLAHPDGRHVLVGGNPARGLTGGGLLIYDLVTGQATVLGREDLIPDQGIMALSALPGGDLAVGTTAEAATGGTRTAAEACVYRLDWRTRRIVARWTPVAGARAVNDLVTGPDGLIYGLSAPRWFFVIDPDTGRTVHLAEVAAYGNVTGMQAPRTMAVGPDGGIYVLFREAIARFEPGTFAHREIGRPGVPITAGIAIRNGRIYFACGSSLWSFRLI
jgi:hypothetical protein